jgi:hypothetical protein
MRPSPDLGLISYRLTGARVSFGFERHRGQAGSRIAAEGLASISRDIPGVPYVSLWA